MQITKELQRNMLHDSLTFAQCKDKECIVRFYQPLHITEDDETVVVRIYSKDNSVLKNGGFYIHSITLMPVNVERAWAKKHNLKDVRFPSEGFVVLEEDYTKQKTPESKDKKI